MEDFQEPNSAKKSEELDKGKDSGKDSISDIRVVKWYDYSSKYGLGYLMSNGSIGVMFNDGTKLIALNENMFEYVVRRPTDKQDVSTKHSFKDYPMEIHKKVLVYNRFKEHFESALKQIVKQKAAVYVKKWIKTKHAVLFRLNNQVLQTVFQDETVLLMNSESKRLVFIDAKGENYVCNIETAAASGNKELSKRLKYTQEVLKHIWTAQTNNKDDEGQVKQEESKTNNEGGEIGSPQ